MAKTRPVGVAILAILGYIGAVATLLTGIALMVGSSAITSLLTLSFPQLSSLALLGTTAFIVTGVVVILCAILDYFIARGLWNGRNWARILILIISALSALGALLSLNIAGLVIDGLIIWYLGFYKLAIAYFR